MQGKHSKGSTKEQSIKPSENSTDELAKNPASEYARMSSENPTIERVRESPKSQDSGSPMHSGTQSSKRVAKSGALALTCIILLGALTCVGKIGSILSSNPLGSLSGVGSLTTLLTQRRSSATTSTSDSSPSVNPNKPAEADVNISILQVDASTFPQVTLYFSALDASGAVVPGLSVNDFTISDGATGDDATAAVVNQVSQEAGRVSIGLLLCTSSSMGDEGKLALAQNAISTLASSMDLANGDAMGLVSFSDQAFLGSGFTNDPAAITTSASAATTGGSHALCDGIIASLWQTYTNAAGPRCIIVITDGTDDASTSSYGDVGEFATSCGIPVFIIGIGTGYDPAPLQQLAAACGGGYVDASTMDATAIAQTFVGIYNAMNGCYSITFTSPVPVSSVARNVSAVASASSPHLFSATRSYRSESFVASDFTETWRDSDYVIPDSDTRAIDASELDGMSLAQLCIAYNEIFARHGRSFDDPMLAEWFNTKTWYLEIPTKYDATTFDTDNPSPLSQVEYDNATTIQQYLLGLLSGSNLFPDAATVPLSGYDLCLPTDLLQTGLSQIQSLGSTSTLQRNIVLLQGQINNPTARYAASASAAAPVAIDPSNS